MRQPKKKLLEAVKEHPNKAMELAISTVTGFGLSIIEGIEQGNIASLGINKVGSMVNSAIQGNLLRDTMRCVQELCAHGNRQASDEATLELFSLFFDTIDLIPPHEREAINTAKKLFLTGLQEGDDAKRHLLQTFLRITSKLTSDDILVLQGCDQLRRNAGADDSTVGTLQTWAENVSMTSLHGIRELALGREANLMELQLIGERHPEDKYRVMLARDGRLTGLGKAYCKFLTEIEP